MDQLLFSTNRHPVGRPIELCLLSWTGLESSPDFLLGYRRYSVLVDILGEDGPSACVPLLLDLPENTGARQLLFDLFLDLLLERFEPLGLQK